jgi:hypothetical protein
MRADDDCNEYWKKGNKQNMQNNLQCRKSKSPTDKLKARTISRMTHKIEFFGQHHNSDNEFSDFDDALSVEAYVEDGFSNTVKMMKPI